MKSNLWIRQTHRWTCIAFTLGAIANIIALVRGTQAVWLGLLSVVPLVLLVLTGLYMFALPYLTRLRRAGPAPAAGTSLG